VRCLVKGIEQKSTYRCLGSRLQWWKKLDCRLPCFVVHWFRVTSYFGVVTREFSSALHVCNDQRFSITRSADRGEICPHCSSSSSPFLKSSTLLPSFLPYLLIRGHAIAQTVSRWLPTAAARVRAQVSSCGICGGQSGVGAGFLRVLRFPLSSLFPPTAPHSSFIIRGWYNRPNSGRRTKWTQCHPTPRNVKKTTFSYAYPTKKASSPNDLHCLHPVVYYVWWHLASTAHIGFIW
jgi:hypothetical protein